MTLSHHSFPYTDIYVDTGLRTLHIAYKGFVPGAVFRETMLYALNLVKTHQLQMCIYDTHQLESFSPQDQDWLTDEVLPLLIQTTVRKVALVESPKGVGNLNLSHMVYISYSFIPFELQYFDDVPASFQWITQRRPQETKATVADQPRSAAFA